MAVELKLSKNLKNHACGCDVACGNLETELVHTLPS